MKGHPSRVALAPRLEGVGERSEPGVGTLGDGLRR